jgi:membrane-bound lytic murein transglycosylase B
MGIETNFGNYLGKMDIISSLATLSFDKRRSDFFTSELITLLKLIDNKVIDPNTLYGSWAGAFGNFQFMPSTIKNYAVDFDNDEKISLKKTEDSFASAANYLNKLGWKNSNPCFYKVTLKSNIPDQYLNISAKKIHSTKKVNYLKKYIQDSNYLENFNNLNAAIITPDAEIVENPDKLSPAYIIFDNYKLILKWNRSLRFALAVCTLKEKFKNEL